MAIALRGTPTFAGGAAGTNVVGTEPTGTTSGDVMVAFCTADRSSGSITPPANWNQLFAGLAGTNVVYWLGWILRSSSAPALTWAWSVAGSTWRELNILSFSGVDNANPIDSSAGGTVTTTNAPNPPAITVVNANAMAIAVCMNFAGCSAGGWTAPSGYTRQSPATTGLEDAVATKALTATGTEDPGTFTNVGSDTSWAATLALKPAGAAAAAGAPFQARTARHPLLRR